MRYNRRMRFFRIDLLKGNLWVQTLLFFIPILIGAFFQQLYNTVDAIVVGQYLGPNALGAVVVQPEHWLICLLAYLWELVLGLRLY